MVKKPSETWDSKIIFVIPFLYPSIPCTDSSLFPSLNNMDSSRVVLPPISTLINDVDQHHRNRQRFDSARPPAKLTIETSPSIVITDPRHSTFHPPSPQSPVPNIHSGVAAVFVM
jgi:hypothetical protein